jgi:hypothetical protein
MAFSFHSKSLKDRHLVEVFPDFCNLRIFQIIEGPEPSALEKTEEDDRPEPISSSTESPELRAVRWRLRLAYQEVEAKYNIRRGCDVCDI